MWGPLRHWQCSEDNINSTKTTIEIQGHSFCVQYTTDKHIVRAIQCINLRMVVSNDILGLCQFLSGCLYYSCFVFLTVELHARIEKKKRHWAHELRKYITNVHYPEVVLRRVQHIMCTKFIAHVQTCITPIYHIINQIVRQNLNALRIAYCIHMKSHKSGRISLLHKCTWINNSMLSTTVRWEHSMRERS